MKYYGETWQAINSLLSQLRSSNVKDLVDQYYLRFNNPAPGQLLQESMDKLQKLLNEARH